MTDLKKALPPLDSLVSFEAAYRKGSFTRAAEELNLSQASVSRQIRTLEQDLGLSLFERRRHDVQPTAHGHFLAESVNHSLSDIASAAITLRNRAKGCEVLTVYSDIPLSNSIVAPHIQEFQKRHPGLRLRLLATTEPIEDSPEPFDIGLQSGQWHPDKFIHHPIADDLLIPVCSPELAAGLPEICAADDLTAVSLLHFHDQGRNWPGWDYFFRALGHPEPQCGNGPEFGSYAALLDGAEQGLGIALAWLRSTQSRLASGRLVQLKGLSHRLEDQINAYFPRNAGRSDYASEFLELLKSRLPAIDP